jgi:RHS repeat-associated protein
MPSPHIKFKHPPHNLHATKRGYQESERDDDVKGDGNSYTTFYRMHDPRLGRWFSTDPVFQPWQSPYNSMDNNPIWHNDVLGDWVKGAGFWRNMKSSDGQIKAEDFSMSKPGSTLSDLGNGNWGVSWITKEKIVAKNIDGNYFDKEILVGNIKAFSDKKSNDLIENDNALFNFMEVLSYGFSHLYGSKDNFGKHEGGSDAFNGGVTRELPDAIGGSFSYGAHGGVGGAEGAGLVIFTDGKDAGIHLYTFDAKGIGVNAGVGVNFYTGNHIGNPNDMKSDFAGDGYDAGGDLFFGGNVWGTLKDDGRGKTSVGWAGVGISVGISVGSNSDKTNTKF